MQKTQQGTVVVNITTYITPFSKASKTNTCKVYKVLEKKVKVKVP